MVAEKSVCAPVPESESVRVVIQARPLLPFESAHNAVKAISVQQNPPLIYVDRPTGRPAEFTAFDAVYGANVDSVPDSLYESHVAPLVNTLFTGINGTVFAYGQTCAGKSYTMKHITERAAADIFLHKRRIETQGDTHVSIRVGFVEIYRESIRDLVDGASAPLGAVHVQIKTRTGKGKTSVFLDGAKERCIDNEAALLAIVREGALLRRTAATGMNASSSRSHSVITMSVIQEPVGDSSDTNSPCLAAKLHLVDLAGSERAKRTAAGGDRFAEGVDINKGLFALAKVISTLADNSSKSNGPYAHVPYRDSKLTRLLQDSLGGTARTLLIACVSPANSSVEETMGTLRYAERARCIRNKPKVNNDVNAVEVSDLRAALSRARAELAALAAENERLRTRAAAPCPSCSGSAARSQLASMTIGSRHVETAGESSDVTQSPPRDSSRRRSPERRSKTQPSSPLRNTETSPCRFPSKCATTLSNDENLVPRRRTTVRPMRAPRRTALVRRRLDDGSTATGNTECMVRREGALRTRALRHNVDGDDDSSPACSPSAQRLNRRTKSASALCRNMDRGPIRGTASMNVRSQLTASSLQRRANATVPSLGLPQRGTAFNTLQKRARSHVVPENSREHTSSDSESCGLSDEESSLASPTRKMERRLASALNESRLEEMRRTFKERLEQAENDKSLIDSERMKLKRHVLSIEEQHAREIEELKAAHQARVSTLRSKLANVKRLEAESTRLTKAREGSDAARKKMQTKVKAVERAREEVVTRLTDMLSKTEVSKLNLDKENRSLARSERQLRLELQRALTGRTKLQSVVTRLRSENEAMRARLRDPNNSNFRRANSSFTPATERRKALGLRD